MMRCDDGDEVCVVPASDERMSAQQKLALIRP
jgi:hypothetical protein